MSVEIRVPDLGESVVEATIARWLKKEGDPVRVENPEQLAAYLRWASVAATFVASEPARHFGPAPWQPFDQGRLVW